MTLHLLIRLALAFTLVSMQTNAAEPVSTTPVRDEPQNIAKQDWAVRLPNQANVVYRGMPSADVGGGSTAAMLYPAPNVAGLLAGLVTHGLLVGNSRRLEANRRQEAADKVLEPYRATIGEFRYEALFELALEQKRPGGVSRIALAGESPAEEWFFVSEPVFSMTQDQRALIFDSAFIVYAPNSPSTPAYQNALRVVSSPVMAEDPTFFWTEQDGKNLKNTSAQLMAMALELAAAEIARTGTEAVQDTAPSHKTIRYLEGKTEKIERAELLRITCDRAVLKNLRGGLMWVPLKQPHAYAVSQTSSLLECGPTVKK